TPNGFDLFHVRLGMLLPPFPGLQRRGVQGYRAVVEIGVLRSASVYYSTPKINVPAAENGDPLPVQTHSRETRRNLLNPHDADSVQSRKIAFEIKPGSGTLTPRI